MPDRMPCKPAKATCAPVRISARRRMEFIPVEGSLTRQDFIGLCALEGECQHEANECDNYSLEFVGFRHFYFLLTEAARAFPFYTLYI